MVCCGFKPIAHHWSLVDQLFDIMSKTACKGPNIFGFVDCMCSLSHPYFKKQPFRNVKPCLDHRPCKLRPGLRGHRGWAFDRRGCEPYPRPRHVCLPLSWGAVLSGGITRVESVMLIRRLFIHTVGLPSREVMPLSDLTISAGNSLFSWTLSKTGCFHGFFFCHFGRK